MSNELPKLSVQESELIEEAEPHSLARLDEDSLRELQSRLRKARDKYHSLMRRRGAARVESQGFRLPDDDRSGEKVGMFDAALARVEERLDSVRDAE